MTIEDKMRTMEQIWDDLLSHSTEVPSPLWHGEILESRKKALKNGDEELVVWNKAKKTRRNQQHHTHTRRAVRLTIERLRLLANL